MCVNANIDTLSNALPTETQKTDGASFEPDCPCVIKSQSAPSVFWAPDLVFGMLCTKNGATFSMKNWIEKVKLLIFRVLTTFGISTPECETLVCPMRAALPLRSQALPSGEMWRKTFTFPPAHMRDVQAHEKAPLSSQTARLQTISK